MEKNLHEILKFIAQVAIILAVVVAYCYIWYFLSIVKQ